MRHQPAFLGRSVLLAVVVATAIAGPQPLWAQDSQPLKGGVTTISYDAATRTATVEVRIKADASFTGKEVTNFQFTLRTPEGDDTVFGGVVSSPAGVAKLGGPGDTGSKGGWKYQKYSGNAATAMDFPVGDEVTMAMIQVSGGSSHQVELAPSAFAADLNGVDGTYYIAYGGQEYYLANNSDPGNEFYDPSTVLPVELVDLNAQLDGGGVVVRWATASETNNAAFEVEHRADEAFASVGVVPGAGMSQVRQTYAFRIEKLAPGRHAFRLKQIDLDGTFTYSPEVELTVEMPGRFVLEPAYPNPFNPQATIRFAVKEAVPVRVVLYNVMGQAVELLYEGTPPAGRMQSLTIDGSRLSSGIYVVRLTGEGISAAERMILTK